MNANFFSPPSLRLNCRKAAQLRCFEKNLTSYLTAYGILALFTRDSSLPLLKFKLLKLDSEEIMLNLILLKSEKCRYLFHRMLLHDQQEISLCFEIGLFIFYSPCFLQETWKVLFAL